MSARTDDGAAPLQVTVLVNNHDYERYLGAAVDSALAQTRPVHVLVVDDGSTDGSLELLARYGDRIEVLALENGGQAAALNRSLGHVRTDLVIVLDADDLLDPDAAERVVRAFAADPACVRVQFRLRVVDGDGRPTGAWVPPRAVPLLDGDLRPALLTHRGWRWPPTSGNAWRTEALRRVPPIPEVAFRQAIDRWWCDLVSLLGTVRALPEPAGSYRRHTRNFTAGEGTGTRYLDVRVQRRQQLHEAARQVAREAGLHHPDEPDGLQDAPLAGWQLSLCKTADVPRVRLRHVRALEALLGQPGVRPVRRLGHAGWYVALLAAPARGRVARRLVRARYGSD